MAATPIPVESTGALAGFTPGAYAVAAGAYGVENTGDVSISLQISSPTEFAHVFIGDASLSLSISSDIAHGLDTTTDLTFGFIAQSDMLAEKMINGHGYIEFVPSSAFEYIFNAEFDGSLQMEYSVNSSMSYWNYERIEPSVSVLSGSINQSVDSNAGSIDPTIDTDTGSIGATI